MNQPKSQGPPSPSKTIARIGIIEVVIAAILLIIGVGVVGLAEENNFRQMAVWGSYIIFFALLWETVLLGVSGCMIYRHPYEGRWAMSMLSSAILLFGNLFIGSRMWLWIICMIIGSALGILGLGVGLAASLHD